MRMKYKVDDIPIRRKFIMLFLLGVLMPIAMLMTYVLTNVATSIRERENLNASMSLERVYSTIETQCSSAVALSNAIAADIPLVTQIDRQFTSSSEYYNTYFDAIKPSVSRYQYAYSQTITDIWLYTDNPTMNSGGYCLRIGDGSALADWFKESDASPNMLVSFIRHRLGYSDIVQLSTVRTIKSRTGYRHVLRIDLDMDEIHRAIERETYFMSIYLVNPDGYAVSYPVNMSDRPVARLDVEPPEYVDMDMSFGKQTAMNGWRLVAVLNAGPIEQSVRRAIWLGLGIGVVFTAIAAALSMVFSRSISQRSRRLLKHMDVINAESFEPIERGLGKDEIGELMQHFNAMGEHLKQLVNDLYILQLKQKSMELENVRAELKYLQAQIDPHFLFNTLNAILVLCVKNGYKDLSEIISALSKILRRMVDTSHDTVTLREEMQFVSMVLKIEQFRFGDKLVYSFDIADDALERSVPMMCVQGLVENACKHGVQHMRETGRISVEARLAGEELVVSVSDNGVGITPARLEELRLGMASQQDDLGGIGLQNIYRRLKLYYGQNAELTLASASVRGTVATIRIPKEREAE